jgi:hypothetical protein
VPAANTMRTGARGGHLARGALRLAAPLVGALRSQRRPGRACVNHPAEPGLFMRPRGTATEREGAFRSSEHRGRRPFADEKRALEPSGKLSPRPQGSRTKAPRRRSSGARDSRQAPFESRNSPTRSRRAERVAGRDLNRELPGNWRLEPATRKGRALSRATTQDFSLRGSREGKAGCRSASALGGREERVRGSPALLRFAQNFEEAPRRPESASGGRRHSSMKHQPQPSPGWNAWMMGCPVL